MNVIRDKDGNIIQRSKNLAGIRRYVAGKRGWPGPEIKTLAIDRIGEHKLEGKLCILFMDGASYEVNFGSFGVLKDWVRRWRNVYGSPLLVNGKRYDVVYYDNPVLVEREDTNA